MPTLEQRTRKLTRDVLGFLADSGAPTVEADLSDALMDDGRTMSDGAARVLVRVLGAGFNEPVPSVVGLYAAWLWACDVRTFVGPSMDDTLDEIEAWLRALMQPNSLRRAFEEAALALRKLSDAANDSDMPADLQGELDTSMDIFDRLHQWAKGDEAR